jgi:hypothetical protein
MSLCKDPEYYDVLLVLLVFAYVYFIHPMF